jgi:hypothetical protein
MAIYRIHFVDHAGSVIVIHEITGDDDGDALDQARLLDLRFIAMGFDLWDGERLVHRQRPSA